MDREMCQFVLSLLMDDRDVPAELADRARAFAEQDAVCRQALDDFLAIRDSLGTVPPVQARAGFTDRVLAAAGVGSPAGAILPLARRLAAAAALVLAVTVLYDASQPGQAIADKRVELQRHVVDEFKPSPFGPDDIDAGLEALMVGPLDTPGNDDR